MPIARSRPFAPTSTEHPLWCSVVEATRRKLSSARVDGMLRDLRFVRVLERALRVGLPSGRLEAWVQTSLLQTLDSTVGEISDGALGLALVPVAPEWRSALGDPAHSFDRFVVGPANQDARDAAVSVAQGAPLRPGLLVLTGPSGAGKTHLLEAIGQLLASREDGPRVLEIAGSELALELVAAIRDQEIDGFRARHRGADALLVDDVHRLTGRAATQEELARTLDFQLGRGAPVVLTSAVPLLELRDFAPALRVRFDSAHGLALRAPDWETRVAIVCDRLRRWSMEADPEAAAAIVSRLGPSLAGLDDALTRLLGHPLCARGAIDVELVREALEPRQLRSGRVPAEAVVSLVVRHFTLRPRELRSATRSPRVTVPRQIVMYLLRRHCGLSYPEIGQRFGRHHTTALHSVRQVTRQLEQNGSLRATIRLLEKELVRSVEAGA